MALPWTCQHCGFASLSFADCDAHLCNDKRILEPHASRLRRANEMWLRQGDEWADLYLQKRDWLPEPKTTEKIMETKENISNSLNDLRSKIDSINSAMRNVSGKYEAKITSIGVNKELYDLLVKVREKEMSQLYGKIISKGTEPIHLEVGGVRVVMRG